ncbi:hypothetical protein [Pseudomonas typographi]|uniref:hypothetical protein n=1 Tax=Pseudomonas typographi TaxID=2715964 RepID=UPI001682205D|nr:hypothetical protein [Pseudomonas typographi]MBD1587703.1 hypothetical protein [Pseudomonas typographi]
MYLPVMGALVIWNYPAPSAAHLLSLVVFAAFSVVCAVQIEEVYARLRLEALNAVGPDACAQLNRTQQLWFCRRYSCTADDLENTSQQLLNRWEAHQRLVRLAGRDALDDRLKAFFSVPDTPRLVAWLTGLLAIVATLLTLGGSIDNVFEGLAHWQFIVAVTVAGTLVIFEGTVVLYFVGQLLRHLADYLFWSTDPALTDRRVYRYLMRMQACIDLPVRNAPALRMIDRAIERLFSPVGGRLSRAQPAALQHD